MNIVTFYLDCRLSRLAFKYTGTVSIARDGSTCQSWSSVTPNIHFYTSDSYFPDESLADAGNHCRNPDPLSNAAEEPWCFTLGSERWLFCDVPVCKGK